MKKLIFVLVIAFLGIYCGRSTDQQAQPGQPGQPTQPVQPTQPTQPGQPGQPVQPGQPGQPVQPTQPIQPAQPTQPVGNAINLSNANNTFNTQGVAGGPMQATSMGQQCRGWINTTAPNHVLNVTEPVNVAVDVSATSDTTLTIVGPFGVQCNDDTNGTNPQIRALFPPGTYQVYVGSYAQGQMMPYTLFIHP